jgi:hypothetical protein
MHRISLFIIAFTTPLVASTNQELVTLDKPVAYWRFDDALDCCAQEATFQHELKASKSHSISLNEPGPRSPKFPGFDAYNLAADFTGASEPAFLRVKDPGPKSVLDFAKGDAFSAEAWAQCQGLRDGQDVIVVSKGNAANETWSVRLRGARVDGAPVARFVFSFHDDNPDAEAPAHRWTSTRGFTPGEDWHHIAVTYTFGKPESMKAWINGVELEGKWSAPSERGPRQSDEDLWIGGDAGVNPETQFPGRLDEIAIFRTTLTTENVKARARRDGAAPALK